MKFCQHCGAEIEDDALFCSKCGCSAEAANDKGKASEKDNSVSVGLVILAVLFPIFGLFYCPFRIRKRTKCAIICGIASSISFMLYCVCQALLH